MTKNVWLIFCSLSPAEQSPWWGISTSRTGDYWVVALGGGLLMLIFLILMVRDGRAGPEPPVRPADGMAHPPAGS